MGVASYLCISLLIHALMLPSCCYGGRTSIGAASVPFPFYVMFSKLLELKPNRDGGGITPSTPIGNTPVQQIPPRDPTPPAAWPPNSTQLPSS